MAAEKLRKWKILEEVENAFLHNIRLLHLIKNGETAVIVTFDEEVYSIGSDKWGLLGTICKAQPYEDIPQKIDVFNDIRISEIYSGPTFFIVRSITGSLFSWGWNNYGQLGINTTTDTCIPTRIAFLENETIITVSCGEFHVLALSDGGAVFSWGYNRRGQLGDGTENDSPIPVMIPLIEVATLCCGRWSSYAVTRNGAVYSWGGNENKQLGVETNPKTFETRPTRVDVVSQYPITKIEVGPTHVLALSATGQLIIWGNHNYGNQSVLDTTPMIIAADISPVRDIAALWNTETSVCQTDSKMYVWGATRKTVFSSFTEISENDIHEIFCTASTNLYEHVHHIDFCDSQVMWKTISLTRNWIHDFELKECLGSASYGIVFKGEHKINNSTIAVKWTCLEKVLLNQNRIPSLASEELKFKNWKAMEREYKVLEGKNHLCIVNVHGSLKLKLTKKEIHGIFQNVANADKYKDQMNGLLFWSQNLSVGADAFFIWMDLCDTNLRLWIDDKVEGTRNLSTQQLKIIHDLTDGMHFLHENRIIHRDLKSENVLIKTLDDNQVQAKIGDFGLGRFLPDDVTSLTTNPTTTYLYKAPELGTPEASKYTLQADLYSLGLVFLEVVLMIHSTSREHMLRGAINNIDNLTVKEKWSKVFEKFKSLISKMIQYECSDRTSNISEVAAKLKTISTDLNTEIFKY